MIRPNCWCQNHSLNVFQSDLFLNTFLNEKLPSAIVGLFGTDFDGNSGGIEFLPIKLFNILEHAALITPSLRDRKSLAAILPETDELYLFWTFCLFWLIIWSLLVILGSVENVFDRNLLGELERGLSLRGRRSYCLLECWGWPGGLDREEELILFLSILAFTDSYNIWITNYMEVLK